MKRIKTVDEFIENVDLKWKSSIVKLREILLSTKLDETVKWGAPVYTLDGKNIIGLGSFKSYIGLWFFQGALLADNHKKLVNAQDGKTKALRQWRFAEEKEIDEKLVLSYIEEAIINQEQGREIKPVRKTELLIPEELEKALLASKDLASAFNELSQFKKREYADYIADAKRADTKIKRIEKIIPMILNKQGLHDKYRKK